MSEESVALGEQHMASNDIALAAVKKALAEYELGSTDMSHWLEHYEEWLDQGKKHSIGGDDEDCTQERHAQDRDDSESVWEDFMQDYSGTNEATYVSGAGLRWKTSGGSSRSASCPRMTTPSTSS